MAEAAVTAADSAVAAVEETLEAGSAVALVAAVPAAVGDGVHV